MKHTNTLINSKKAFTLAEVLIVVAIIGVLVGAAVPLFSSLSEKAKEAADLANIRTAYAEVMLEAVTDPSTEHTANVTLTQQKDDWETGSTANTTLMQLGNVEGTPAYPWNCLLSWNVEAQKIVFHFNGDGSDDSVTGYIIGDSRKAIMSGTGRAIKDIVSQAAIDSDVETRYKSMIPVQNFKFKFWGETEEYSCLCRELSIQGLYDRTMYWDSQGQKHTWGQYLSEKGISSDIFSGLDTNSNNSIYLDENCVPIAVSYFVSGAEGPYRYVYFDEQNTTIEFSGGAPKNGRQYFSYHMDEAISRGAIIVNDDK